MLLQTHSYGGFERWVWVRALLEEIFDNAKLAVFDRKQQWALGSNHTLEHHHRKTGIRECKYCCAGIVVVSCGCVCAPFRQQHPSLHQLQQACG